MQQSVEIQEIPMAVSKLGWLIKPLNTLKTVNLFQSDSNDVETVRHERWSTRLYIGIFSVFTISLIIYAALLSRTITVTISEPSENTFKQLDDHYSDTLKCPCSIVDIQYSDFVQSQVTFHEVCESQFISQEWIDAIYSANVSFLPPTDVRTTLSAVWQLVRSFCDLAKSTLADANTDFNSTLLLSPEAQSQVLIETKVQASREFSLTSAETNLKRNLLITRELTLGNGLFSGLATNYYFYLTSQWTQYAPSFDIAANVFADGCSCANLNGCPRPAIIFQSNVTSNWTNVPGMMFDCLPLDAALSSSLECFYEPWCLSLIQQLSSINVKPPPPLSAPSHFPHNVTLNTLLNELMIEQLTRTPVFSLYYAQCNPDYCTYSYSRRFDILFIITLLASAFGGVSVVLRLFIPLLIKLAFKVYTWKRNLNSIGIVDEQQPDNHRR